jgi:hypothetical protein
MNTNDVLQTLSELPNSDRLTIAATALRLMRQDWQSLTPEQKEHHQLSLSAQLAVLDYLPGSQLTELTALDSEDFYKDLDEAAPPVNLGIHA